MERGVDPFAELKQAREEYSVYDSHYEKIGKVDDVFVDEGDRALYVGVKMGFLGTSSTLIPTEIIRVNDRRRLIEVSEPAETIKHAPHFGSNEQLLPELENHVRTYFGLEPLRASPEHAPREPDTAGRLGPDIRVDTEPGERAGQQERYPPSPGGLPPVERAPQPPPESTPSLDIPIGPSEGAGDRWEREGTVSGTTVHRRRR